MPTFTRIHSAWIAGLLVVAACKSDKPTSEQPAAKTAEPTASAPAPTPASDGPHALAAKPKAVVSIEALGVSIEVPEGTTVTPPRDPDSAKRRANLKQDDFMVNVSAVDEYSTPDFAKAKEVYKDDKLVSWIKTEETKTGWTTFKEVVSSMHKSNRFEVDVRTEVAGKKWDCSISAPSKSLGELALAACLTLK